MRGGKANRVKANSHEIAAWPPVTATPRMKLIFRHKLEIEMVSSFNPSELEVKEPHTVKPVQCLDRGTSGSPSMLEQEPEVPVSAQPLHSTLNMINQNGREH